MSVWRCRVCEGVNQGGRTCVTCGTAVPAGEPLRAAVRTHLPATRSPRAAAPSSPPPPVPPTPTRRELRVLPTIEDLLTADPSALFMPGTRMTVRPMPGGCLVAPVPVRRRRRFWY